MSALGREIYASPNGDRWHLLYDAATGHSFVRHNGNPASGGHVTDISLPGFLASGRSGPEHQALWQMIASLVSDGNAPAIVAARSARISDRRGPAEGNSDPQ